jgi:hypothetical protein
MYLCNQCAPELDLLLQLSTIEMSFHIGDKIIGICESGECQNSNEPVETTIVRDYRLRESCGGEE